MKIQSPGHSALDARLKPNWIVGEFFGADLHGSTDTIGTYRTLVMCDSFDESSLSMEILIWASSRWLKTVIRPIDSVIWGHYKPVSYQLKVDFRG